MPESSRPEPLTPAIHAEREKTVVALVDHFSNDRLTVEEFERRLDVANRVQTVPELTALLADLPAVQVPAAAATARPPARHARNHQTLVAIMGGVERRGSWLPARRTLLIAMMGGGELDFRDVVLPAGETEVTVICLMGGAEIIVPPDMHVDVGGLAIMGAFEHQHNVPVPADENAPRLHINGFAMMGGVEVSVRLRGETAKEARQRRRDERRRLKDERRRS